MRQAQKKVILQFQRWLPLKLCHFVELKACRSYKHWTAVCVDFPSCLCCELLADAETVGYGLKLLPE